MCFNITHKPKLHLSTISQDETTPPFVLYIDHSSNITTFKMQPYTTFTIVFLDTNWKSGGQKFGELVLREEYTILNSSDIECRDIGWNN